MIDVREVMTEEPVEPKLTFVSDDIDYVKRGIHDENEVHCRREALRRTKRILVEEINMFDKSMTFELADKYNELFAHFDRLIREEASLYGMHL